MTLLHALIIMESWIVQNHLGLYSVSLTIVILSNNNDDFYMEF